MRKKKKTPTKKKAAKRSRRPKSASENQPERMLDFETGELLDYGPGGMPAGPIAAEATPFAHLRNSVHRLGLAGSDNVDAAAQELAQALDEALPTALQTWPDAERLLPLQQMRTHLAGLHYRSNWKRTLELLMTVRDLLPDLLARARIAEVATTTRNTKVTAHRGTAKKLERMRQLRQLLVDPEWKDAVQIALAAKLRISERTLRNYLDEIGTTGK